MGKFLDETGLSELWKRIKDKFGFTINDTLTLQNNLLSVSTPVKGVLKEEFDHMSDAEKKGLVVVIDDNPPFIGQSGEIYSDKETLVGTWMGKPMYRKVFKGTTNSSAGTNTTIGYMGEYDVPQKIYGTLISTPSYNRLTIPYISISTSNEITHIRTLFSNTEKSIVVNSSLTDKEVYIIVEYTKTND